MQQMIFIADLIPCSTCFGQHYAHLQELESIIQVVAACRIWCFGFFQVVGMVWSWGLRVRFASNKNHLLHLVGILFPQISASCWLFKKKSFTMHGNMNVQERYYLGDPGVDGRIILRWIFRKWQVGVWTGLIWLRIGTGGGHLWIR